MSWQDLIWAVLNNPTLLLRAVAVVVPAAVLALVVFTCVR